MSSEATMSPSGGVDSRHVMEGYSLGSVTVAQVLESENLQKAWKQVKANKGAPGVDNMTIEEFPEYAARHWEGIRLLFWKGRIHPLRSRESRFPRTVEECARWASPRSWIASYNRRFPRC